MSEPVAKAILLCNFAMQDNMCRRSLIACFDSVRQDLPGVLPSFYLFVRVADAPIKAIEMLQIEDPKGIVVWSSGPKPYDQGTGSPKKYLESIFMVPPIGVVLHGRYRIIYLMDSERVAETELNVDKAQQPIPA